MAVLLPFLAFGLFFILNVQYRLKRGSISIDLRDSFMIASIGWGLAVVVITETLSGFRALDKVTVALAWGCIVIVLGICIWRLWNDSPGQKKIVLIPLNLSKWTKGQKLLLVGLFFVLATTFLIAIYSPPNNNDSLAYHVSRVVHWIQNRSVAPYPTVIARQNFMPPWSEYVLLNLSILTWGDQLVNLVQWLAMIGCILGVSRLVSRFGVSLGGQLSSAVFIASLPMAILQSSSTQNDLITAFWSIVLANLVVTAIRTEHIGWYEGALLGAVCGLGVLTKGTFLAFCLPLLAWLGWDFLKKRKFQDLLKIAIIILVLTLALNFPFWARNHRTYESFLGPKDYVRRQAGMYIDPRLAISNAIKNVVFHIATPIDTINAFILDGYQRIHKILGVSIDSTTHRVKKEPFSIVGFSNHEDITGNPLHFALLILLIVVIAPRASASADGSHRAMLLVWISSFILFSFLYPWQPWGSRLQLPWFILGGVVYSLSLKAFQSWKLTIGLCGLLFISAIPWLFLNRTRPLISYQPITRIASVLQASDEVKLFANSPDLRMRYSRAIGLVQKLSCEQVGLKIDSSDREYYFWDLIGAPWNGIQLRHIDVDGWFDTSPQELFTPCVIICTVCGSEAEVYNGLPFFGAYGEVRVFASH